MGTPDPERWQRVRAVFDDVADLAPAARAARLTTLCAGDDDLRADVESLLAHDRPAAEDPIGRLVAGAARGASAALAPMAPGAILMHYRISAPIGEGGMGVVWRAVDQTLGREVAIKVLPASVSDDPRRLARFEREAKLLASLNHSNIAAIFSIHLHEGVRFLAMEYVPGEDLSARLARGVPPLDETLRIARQIAEALEEAHERGVVHRDLKPANVKLTPTGRVKVLDFGLAKAFSDTPSSDTALSTSNESSRAQLTTRQGVVLGTAAYMPPEQARGAVVDKRADIWAFGVVLFEMLAGERPFLGPTVVDVLAAVISREPDWARLPAGTPPGLERLLRRCLQKDVRQRLRDIGDARIELEHLIGGSSDHALVVPRAAAVATLPAPRPRRHVAAVAGLVIAGLAVSAMMWLRPAPAPAADAPIERFNIALPPGGRLEDVSGGIRQALAFSADGTRLAFLVRERDGRRQIYLRRLDRVAAAPVEGAEGGDMPFFSPDGQWLGFAADGKLKKVRLSGGQPVVVCPAIDPRGASWGDDGAIVFAGLRGGLWRVPSDGGTPVALTFVDPARGEDRHRWPLVLPGSRGVVFTAETGDDVVQQRVIDVLDVASGQRRTLVRGASYPRYAAGTLLYGQAGTLYTAPFDPGTLSLTGPAEPRIDDVRMDLAATGRVFAELGPSGALAYVPGYPRVGARRLTWVDRQGQVTLATPEARGYRAARLSPDGRSVAVIVQDVAMSSLWLLDLARHTFNRLANDGDDSTPAWTRDGRRIVFSGSPKRGPGLFWVAADGSAAPAPLLVASTLVVDMPEALPGGTHALAAVQNAAGDGLYRVSLDGQGTLETVLDGPASEVSPALSPSGRFLAYSSDESGRREVYIRSMRGDGRKWTVSASGGGTPRWRADERELFYVEGDALMAVPLDDADTLTPGTPRALFVTPALTWGDADLSRYDVTPDGQRFLLVQPEAREVAPLAIVVAPRFVRERSTPRQAP